MTFFTSSPKRAKSADKMEGAMRWVVMGASLKTAILAGPLTRPNPGPSAPV
jgi:hypothetical protein